MGSKIPLIFFLLIRVLGASAEEFNINQAKRVNTILNSIAKQRHLRREAVVLKSISFSEDEFNSYLNTIYCPKFIPEVEYFKIELYEENQVEARARIELPEDKYPKIPAFFRSFTLQTSGQIFSRDYRMRYQMDALKINQTGFSPEVLDETFGAFQSGYQVKKSLFDWFHLLPGIKKVTTEYQKITFYY